MTTDVREAPATTDGSRSVSVSRKIAGAVAIVVGIVFLAMTFMNNLFEVGPAFEELIDDFRPILTSESLDTARTDVAGLAAAGEEFTTVVAPGMAQALGLSAEEFTGMMQAQYPDVFNGVVALPEITATFNGLIDTLDSQQDLFASADAIPTNDLPATTVPWIITISGILAIVLGALLFMPGRLWAFLLFGFGAVLIIVTFALSLPQKAADADQLNENLSPIYTQELIDGANVSLATVSAMGAQLQTEMFPDLAAQLGMNEEQLGAFFGENFPATAAAVQTMPEAIPRFEAFVGTFDTNLANYEVIQPVAFAPIIWVVLFGGVVLLLAGGFCLVTKK